MTARDMAYKATRAIFDAPHKREPTNNEIRKTREVMALLKDMDNDEVAQVLLGCILVLGDRLAATAAA